MAKNSKMEMKGKEEGQNGKKGRMRSFRKKISKGKRQGEGREGGGKEGRGEGKNKITNNRDTRK